MKERDVERSVTRKQFIASLRRLADALENNKTFRIQVQNKRFTVPADAALSIEHEIEGDEIELELQMKWITK